MGHSVGSKELKEAEADSLRKRTRCTFFNSLFAHICEKSCIESSILFVRGSSSRY